MNLHCDISSHWNSDLCWDLEFWETKTNPVQRQWKLWKIGFGGVCLWKDSWNFQAILQGVSHLIDIFWMPWRTSKFGWKSQNKVFEPSQDVDIYENVKQTSLSQMISEVWFVFSSSETHCKSWPTSILERAVYTKENGSYLQSHLTWRCLLYIFINVHFQKRAWYLILIFLANIW